MWIFVQRDGPSWWAFGGYWRILEDIGGFWRILEDIGGYFRGKILVFE